MPGADRFPVRRETLVVEEIHHEGGPPTDRVLRKAAALVVVANPFAGRYEPEIEDAMSDLEPLGRRLASRLVDALGGADQVAGYGKGAIVGEDGELEHGALWHVPGGYAMRDALGEALAIVPSTKKVGGPGARLDVPITHKDASYVRSHFDAMEVGVPFGPAPDEIVFALVMTDGGRIHARVGGLTPDQITERNGLR
jgi:hypothetical protein